MSYNPARGYFLHPASAEYLTITLLPAPLPAPAKPLKKIMPEHNSNALILRFSYVLQQVISQAIVKQIQWTGELTGPNQPFPNNCWD